MSFARLKENVCNVYVYANTENRYVCQWCSMQKLGGKNFSCRSADTMINHLYAHRSRGDLVPDNTIKELNQEVKINVYESCMHGCEIIQREKNKISIPEPEIEMAISIKFNDGSETKKGIKCDKKDFKQSLHTLVRSVEISVDGRNSDSE